MAKPGDAGFVKQIEQGGDAAKSKLKKTNTNEKKWTPTAADIKADKASK
jgi:hypothetical protein